NREYQVYLNTTDISKVSAVTTLAGTILETSLFVPLGSAEIIALAQQGASSDLVFYEDGQVSGGFNEFIAPGIFVVLFYIIFAFSVGYMLRSIIEEIEKRVMEIVLSYVRSRTLILDKLLGVILVTLTQVAFFALLGLIAMLVVQQT